MGAKDRLQELKQAAGERLAGVDGESYDTDDRDDDAACDSSDLPNDVNLMFKQVDEMRWWIHDLNFNTQFIKRLHTDPTFHNNSNLQEQLDSVIRGSKDIGAKLCASLRSFEARATRQDNAAASRMARLQYAATRRLYADALANHHDALRHVRDQRLRLLHQQIKLTNVTISEEECEALLDSNNISLFVDNVQAETAAARTALRDAEARHEELVRVERSLREVRDMFAELSHLVAQQQDSIDSVEYYALQATDLVGEGGIAIYKGRVKRTGARKKKIGLIICLVTGFSLVLLVLILT